VALLFVARVWLTACSNSVEGIQEGTSDPSDEAQEELNDGEGG
jgi:hypothetical protein